MQPGPPMNPYESPKAPPGGASRLREVPVDEVPAAPSGGAVVATAGTDPKSQVTWRIVMGDEELWLVPPDGPHAYALTHLEVAELVELVLFGGRLGLVVRGHAKPFTLWIPAESDALLAWLGARRRLHLDRILKKRLRYSMPLGAFVVAFAMPPLAIGWDPLHFVFGAGLLAIGILRRFRPDAILLLLNAVCWLCLAAASVLSFARDDSKSSLLFAGIQVLIAWGSIKAYGLFRRIPDREPR
ncbi:MAG: hypothetical protein JST00_44400 [Deltaproteobacteria bacterium]|nr:hypothetical protein [Deltaproteobacteria bacterium]